MMVKVLTKARKWLGVSKEDKIASIKSYFVKFFFLVFPKSTVTAYLSFGKFYVTNDWTGKNIYTGRYDEEERKLLKKIIKPGWRVFDIGANIGFYSIFLAKEIGCSQIVCFEPSPKEYGWLSKNLRLNNLEHLITTEQIALSNTVGKGNFYLSKKNSGENTLLPDRSKEYSEVEIDMTTLDSYVEKNSVTALDFIKLDVEGNELKVLQGAQRTVARFHPVIFIEIWNLFDKIVDDNTYDLELVSFLEKHSYRLHEITEDGTLRHMTRGRTIKTSNFLALPQG